MKNQRVRLLSVIFTMVCLQASAQEMFEPAPSAKVLFSANGMEYTQAHFDKEVRFVEFIIGAPMSKEEKRLGLQETAQSFTLNPAGVIQAANEVDAQMQQILQITDIARIGQMRTALITQIYAGAQFLPEKPFIVKLMEQKVPLLAVDMQNMLTFTEGDFQAYLQWMQFQAQLSGQPLNLMDTQIAPFRQALVQQFPTMSLEQKTSLCGMQVLYQYLSNAYAQMTPEQKQQMQAQMVQQQQMQQQLSGADAAFAQGVQQAQQQATMAPQWPAGVDTTAEKQAHLQQMRRNMNANNAAMSTYYDTMMGTHATMLNTIENFGDTGTYWEYK